MYAFWPETKGRSLEQMDSLFGEVDVLRQVALEVQADENAELDGTPTWSGDLEKGTSSKGQVHLRTESSEKVIKG